MALISQSAASATHTMTIMPPLCHAPSRSFALDQRPSLLATAEPTSQSANIRHTHTITSQPNQPHRAVSVAMTPVITVLMCSAELFSMGHLRFFALAFPGLHQKPFVHKISPLLFGMDAEF